MARRIPFSCSFCGKPQSQRLRLIAGPNGVYICAECVALCNEILTENPVASSPAQQAPRSSPPDWRRLLRGWIPDHWWLSPGHI